MDGKTDVNTRNITSLAEAMKLLRDEDTKLRDRIANSENTVESLRSEIEALRGLVMASMNRNIGPTG